MNHGMHNHSSSNPSVVNIEGIKRPTSGPGQYVVSTTKQEQSWKMRESNNTCSISKVATDLHMIRVIIGVRQKQVKFHKTKNDIENNITKKGHTLSTSWRRHGEYFHPWHRNGMFESKSCRDSKSLSKLDHWWAVTRHNVLWGDVLNEVN